MLSSIHAKAARNLRSVGEFRRLGALSRTLAGKAAHAHSFGGVLQCNVSTAACSIDAVKIARFGALCESRRLMSSSAPRRKDDEHNGHHNDQDHDEHDEHDEDDKKINSPHVSWKEKSKIIFKKYGTIALVFHSSVFLATLGGIYWGTTHGVAVDQLMKYVPWLESNPDLTGIPGYSKLGTLGLAYGMTLTTGPVRTILTIMCTPPIGRTFFGKRRRKNNSHQSQTNGRAQPDSKK